MRLWCPMLWCMWSQCVVAAECPAQLRMAYNASWRPYIEVTDEVVRGSDIDLIRQLLSKVSSRLQLQFVPEKRAMHMLQQGQVDMLFAASYTPQRAEFAWFSDAYRKEQNVVLIHRQTLSLYPELRQREAFLALAQRKLIGVYNPAGFYGDTFEQLKQQPAVKQRSLAVYEPERRLDLISGRRADYTIADNAAVQLDLAARKDGSQFEILPFFLNEADIHLMLSKVTVPQSCVLALNRQLTVREKTTPVTDRSVLGSD
jgi:polar amino acid transport system substrate-binding protein